MSAAITRIHPDREPQPRAAVLTLAAAIDLDQAELFLLSLETETLTADSPRVAYLLGLAEGHLANLIQLARGLTR